MSRRVIYRNIGRQEHYWTTCGWSRSLCAARCYRTMAEAESVYHRMARSGIHAAIGTAPKR